MKKYWLMLKNKLPYYQKKLFEAIPFILIYQALLFVLSPTKINQVMLVVMVVAFTLTQFGSKD